MSNAPENAAAPAGAEAGTALEGGSYDVIRKRLLEQAAELGAKVDALNAKRKAVFGGSEVALLANERVRTENNCVPRDITSIGGKLLFGYNVFIGLRTETIVADVLSLHRFAKVDEGFDLSGIVASEGDGFLGDPTFVKEFRDLYRYTKDTRLLSLRRTDTRLLAIFQIGATPRDVKVFRWGIEKGGGVRYLDARGEEDNVAPRSHDFHWTLATREDHVDGRYPHVSILDEVFVETIGGDLTIKVENNTEEGRGIWREPVEHPNQTLDDAEIAYAKLGSLILLRVRPFREAQPRYLVFNTRTRKVARIDAIGQACLSLPEDHGIVFPGGFYLRAGGFKVFEGDQTGLAFTEVVRSPNGEDVLYVFHREGDGHYLLLPYNLIRKEVANPIRCQGYSLFDDGKMIVFREQSAEPTRVHPMQVWQTPFTTPEFAASAPTDGSYLAKVGNADLVRGISEAYTLKRTAELDTPTRQTFEDVITATQRMIDAYYWLGHAEAGDLRTTVEQVRKTTELIVDEFEKVAAIRARAEKALGEAELTQEQLLAAQNPDDLTSAEAFMGALTSLRKQRGHLITMRELRFMDLERVTTLEAAVVARFDELARACVEFLLRPASLEPLTAGLTAVIDKIDKVTKAAELIPLTADIDRVSEGLTLLGEVVGSLPIDDATARTRVLEGISEVYAQQNRARATLQARKKDLATTEGRAEFGAQIKLFGQSVVSALAQCDTPERCDDALSRLLVQLEELEGRFGELDEFLGDLAQKREEVADAIAGRRQTLLDERQRRVRGLLDAASRIAQGVARRARTFASADELNAYFASDAMVLKLKDLATQLLALGQTVQADEVESKLKTARQDALRTQRDREDLFDEGLIKLGRHRFHVATQAIELTLVPRSVGAESALYLHLAGTDFYEPIEDATLASAKDLWDQPLVSESPDVYRGEYLAFAMLDDAEHGTAGLTVEGLSHTALDPAHLLDAVRAYAADRHDEGYERGVHDADAALLLERLLSLRKTAGLLRFSPDARAVACLFWAQLPDNDRAVLARRSQSLGRIRERLGQPGGQTRLAAEIEPAVAGAAALAGLAEPVATVRAASRYLVLELAADPPRFTTTEAASSLVEALRAHLAATGADRAFDEDMRALEQSPRERLDLALAWLDAFTRATPERAAQAHLVKEAAVLLVTARRVDRLSNAAVTDAVVAGLLGQHPRISERKLALRLDELYGRLDAFRSDRAPRFRAYRKARHEVTTRERARLRIDELLPRVLSSFVRNRLIDEVYLPLIGDNLAKQLGAAGDAKRTDLMGLLLLVSPPGYGKTTLMEYVASQLGLVFMKVNGPALGHEVKSLDPNDAPNATARQEVDKINLALEMGNNVMLYLDDIQHTNPELLQKFISLCDAQRKIEGVWRGRTRTYDLRGKKFCVVMAGNPYTESGAKFQIPDMLANRADTYNLGDILDGKADVFALSYIENSLTSNRVLAPLAGRAATDVHKLLAMARGGDAPGDLSYGYSGAEVAEIVAVFERLFAVQKTLLQVNLQYIASASQDDAFRTEPSFKLQGSYRNMNKLAEKVVSAHTPDELERLVDDHYTSESQTLTTGAEHNLLKLAELRGRLSAPQRERWEAIKADYVRGRITGGSDADPVARVTGTINLLGREVEGIKKSLDRAADSAQRRAVSAASRGDPMEGIRPALSKLESALTSLARPKLDVKVERDPAIAELLAQQIVALERTILPLARAAADTASAQARAVASGQAPPSAETSAALDARLGEITAMLRALGDNIGHGGPGAPQPPRFDVALAMHSPSNFYRGVHGGEVTQTGGLFVATYRKLPLPGSHVALRVGLPGGLVIDLGGTVEWVREAELDGHEAPGFGVRLAEMPADARSLVHQFMVAREPFLREPG